MYTGKFIEIMPLSLSKLQRIRSCPVAINSQIDIIYLFNQFVFITQLILIHFNIILIFLIILNIILIILNIILIILINLN